MIILEAVPNYHLRRLMISDFQLCHYFFQHQSMAQNYKTYPPKTNMTMENQPFEDVFPIENGDIPWLC